MPKISELTDGTAVTDTTEFPANDGGTTKKFTGREIAEHSRKSQFLPVALTDAATIAVDASTLVGATNMFTVTLGGNRTLGNPTNAFDGQELAFRFIQDGTGSRTLTLGSKYVVPAGQTLTLSTAAGSVDYMKAIYHASRDEFDVIAFIKGFA